MNCTIKETESQAKNHRFTKIPNNALEWLMGGESFLTLRETKIMLCVFRQTFGYGRASVNLSSRFVANATGLDSSNVTKAFASLRDRGLITVEVSRKIRRVTILPKVYKNTSSYRPDGVETTPEQDWGQNDLDIGVDLAPKKERKENKEKKDNEGVAGPLGLAEPFECPSASPYQNAVEDQPSEEEMAKLKKDGTPDRRSEGRKDVEVCLPDPISLYEVENSQPDKLNWRQVKYAPSTLEQRFLRERKGWGIPMPVPELQYRSVFFDFTWRRPKVALEIHGGKYIDGDHDRPVGREHDRLKKQALEAHGFIVIQADTDQIKEPGFYAELLKLLKDRCKAFGCSLADAEEPFGYDVLATMEDPNKKKFPPETGPATRAAKVKVEYTTEQKLKLARGVPDFLL